MLITHEEKRYVIITPLKTLKTLMFFSFVDLFLHFLFKVFNVIFSVFLADNSPSGKVVLRIACWCRYTYLNSVLNVLDVNSALPVCTVFWNRPQEIIQWNWCVAERGNPLCVNGQGGLIYLGYVWSLCYNVFHAPYFKVRSFMNRECSTILRARKWKTVR